MKIIATILMSLAVLAVHAQKPEADVDQAYFHPAASLYIHGDTAAASNLVVKGLSAFPDNAKLLRLKELLEQQEQNQENQEQDQDDQQQNDEQQQQENSEQDNQEPNEDRQDRNNDQNEPQDQSQQPEPQPSAEQMSRDEAERLLDAMKQDEEKKRNRMKLIIGNPVEVDKDW